MAERHADLFDGVVSMAPAMRWPSMITGMNWPQVVMNNDLGGVMGSEKLSAVTTAAVGACDDVGGSDYGYIIDPESCSYDPMADEAMLCEGEVGRAGVVGVNADTTSCLTVVEAQVVNKMWYGPTIDGSVPDPAVDNGYKSELAVGQLWFGLPRGTDLSSLTGESPFTIATDYLALVMEDPAIAEPNFQNAMGNGEGRWRAFSYLGEEGTIPFSYAFDRSRELFSTLIGNDPDLRHLQETKTKLLMVPGMHDTVIPVQGAINYYEQVMDRMGGAKAAQESARMFLVPGVGHGGTPNALPTDATIGELLQTLQDWVELGDAPDEIVAHTYEGVLPEQSRPLCMYPAKVVYVSGDVNQATSFECQ